jgi:hypothetical protein
MESTCDIGDTERRLVYISEETRGGIWADVVGASSSIIFGDDDDNGYSIPNSEKYQSGISVEDVSPTEMTGLSRTAAENRSGYRPMT